MQAQTLEITATRVPEPVERIPADLTIVSGGELRERGASDLGSSLGLTAGTEAPAGGDTGPAGAVPSFWGLHEFDAFLLVVDGVPWGGAFNPAIPTLDLNGVERIEVLKGAAPVMYGATSFVGVIHVLHGAPGKMPAAAQIAYGEHNSWQGALTSNLSALRSFDQSLLIDGMKRNFSSDRTSIENEHVLYRAGAPFAGGNLRFDADITRERQDPSSPIVRTGAALTSLTPIDANYNPRNAKIDEDRYHATLGYESQTTMGDWDTTLSFAHSEIADIRGFLRPDLIDDGSSNADSQDQTRMIQDVYFDSHLSGASNAQLSLVAGVDLLYGFAKQASRNGEYYVPLSGLVLPALTTAIHIDETNKIADTRWFWGQYVQVDWKPDDRWDVLAGLRLNETGETRKSTHLDGFDPLLNEFDTDKRSKTRLSGTIGASYRFFRDGADEDVFYADYRNSFKPAAIDFGPDNTPDVLNPETASGFEAGLKGTLAGGRIDYQAEAFLLDFKNLVVATTDLLGNPVLRNAGGERLKGVELETRLHLDADFTIAANASYHDARFKRFVIDDGGANVDVSGNRLTLAPRVLASLGLIYSPPSGLDGSVVANFFDKRFLDEENTATAPSYTMIAASLGYRLGHCRFSIEGQNLSDEREPVTQSEFGAGAYYVLSGRQVFARLSVDL